MTFPALWFTSGTLVNTGQRECAMERWLGYHAGRHGTGYRRHATAIPLATGSAVHQGMELIGGWILEYQQKYPMRRLTTLPDQVTAWAATEAATRYEQTARTRGLELTKTDLDAAAAVEQLILEQRTLIEAQVWIYALARLPIMLSKARLLNVEHEESPVIDCTCGLGEWFGDWRAHHARNCTGIVAQGRSDFLWLLDTQSIAYEEFKTKAVHNYGWEQAWEHSSQLLLNMEAASRRLGQEVTQAFVPVLFKGKRDRTDRDDQSSPKIQQTPLVYGWFDPGNGMGRDPDWAARYKWFDDWGKWHTLPKTYRRTPVWDPQYPLPETNPNGVVIRPEASRVERWVRGWILPGQYAELLKVLGPFQKPRVRIPDAEESLKAEERRWRDDVTFLRESGIFEPGDVVQTVDQGSLTAGTIISRSWHCTKFDGTKCAFFKVCHKEAGWEDLRTHPDFEIRTPHHSSEKDAMTEHVESLGLTFATDDADEETGD